MVWTRSRLFFWTVVVTFITYTDGCGRSPARTKPTVTTPTPRTTTATREKFDKVCTPKEVATAACLNGGTCYALDLMETRSAHCSCPEKWDGLRCEQMDSGIFDNVLTPDQVHEGGIAAGVLVVILVVTVVIIYFIIKKRKARRKREEEAAAQANGHVSKSLMQDTVGCPDLQADYRFDYYEKSETNV